MFVLALSARARHKHPFPGGRVAHNIAFFLVCSWTDMQKQQEPIAGIREDDLVDLGQLREEGEGRVDGGTDLPSRFKKGTQLLFSPLSSE